MTEMQELQQLEEKARDLTFQLDELKAKRSEYSRRLDDAQQQCRRAEDYRQVMNLLSAHVHCSLNQEYRWELDNYWSSRDDIAYANSDIAYIGRKAVYTYYAERAEKRAAAANRSDGKTPGYRQMNLIGTPYVEIAGDGETAIGIWMSHSWNASTESGEASYQGVLGRYSGEFIKENGVWKIWRRRFYADLVSDEGFAPSDVSSADAGNGCDPDHLQKGCVTSPVGVELKAVNNSYTPTSVPSGVPGLPLPYETWSEDQSYIRYKEDAAK